MTIKKSNKLLVQISEIVEYTGISEQTIKKMVVEVGFPARKFLGSWYSSTDAIEDWMYENCYKKKKAVEVIKK